MAGGSKSGDRGGRNGNPPEGEESPFVRVPRFCPSCGAGIKRSYPQGCAKYTCGTIIAISLECDERSEFVH